VFLNFNNPLVSSIRDFMIAKGATEVEEDLLPTKSLEARVKGSQLRVPRLANVLTKRRGKRSDGTLDKPKGGCSQS
jgi:hypothetical protein